MRLITSNHPTKFVEHFLLEKDGLFTGAKFRWETRLGAANRETLHASCEMEVENQKKIINKYTHIDQLCQSVTVILVLEHGFVGYHPVGDVMVGHSPAMLLIFRTYKPNIESFSINQMTANISDMFIACCVITTRLISCL